MSKKKENEELKEDIEEMDDDIINDSDDDDDDVDIVINTDETDSDDSDSDDDDVDDADDVDKDVGANLSKHKAQGKHSLKYDSIFKGKKEDPVEEGEEIQDTYFNDNFDIDRGSILYDEYRDNEQYLREKKIKEKVYDILSKKTEINFLNNRRKPSRSDFNSYYLLLVVNLKKENFSHTELFNELAVYFSDNLFNMFKLLDNKWRTYVINELQDHVGKNDNSKQINKRNLQVGTEIEFTYIDILDEEKMYTGIIISESDNVYRVNSYENIYDVDILNISKILNNKFKYNLNKLNNIDFL